MYIRLNVPKFKVHNVHSKFEAMLDEEYLKTRKVA